MEPLLVENVAYFLSSFFRDGERLHNQRRPSFSRAKWFDARTLS
jgi:hypothetical protein